MRTGQAALHPGRNDFGKKRHKIDRQLHLSLSSYFIYSKKATINMGSETFSFMIMSV
jgi:hypothetical protein